MDKEEINKIIDQRVNKILQGSGFTARKLTDTPTDDLQVVPRKYVNFNGVVASRPTSSVATMGQFYFATDTVIPMRYNRNASVWVNGIGSVVAQG